MLIPSVQIIFLVEILSCPSIFELINWEFIIIKGTLIFKLDRGKSIAISGIIFHVHFFIFFILPCLFLLKKRKEIIFRNQKKLKKFNFLLKTNFFSKNYSFIKRKHYLLNLDYIRNYSEPWYYFLNNHHFQPNQDSKSKQNVRPRTNYFQFIYVSFFYSSSPSIVNSLIHSIQWDPQMNFISNDKSTNLISTLIPTTSPLNCFITVLPYYLVSSYLRSSQRCFPKVQEYLSRYFSIAKLEEDSYFRVE